MTCLVQRVAGYVANLAAAYRQPFDDRAADRSWIDDLEARRAAWDAHTADGLADAAEAPPDRSGIDFENWLGKTCAAPVSPPLQVVSQAAGAAHQTFPADFRAAGDGPAADSSAQDAAAGHLRNVACAVAHYYHLDVFGTEALLARMPADAAEQLYKHIQK